MKRLSATLIHAAALFASGGAFAQVHIEPHNFYWQRVVEYRGTPSAMRDRIIASGIFSDIQRNDSTMIVGRVENVLLNYATMEPEARLFSLPIFFRNGEKFSGTLIYYELKPGCQGPAVRLRGLRLLVLELVHPQKRRRAAIRRLVIEIAGGKAYPELSDRAGLWLDAPACAREVRHWTHAHDVRARIALPHAFTRRRSDPERLARPSPQPQSGPHGGGKLTGGCIFFENYFADSDFRRIFVRS